MLLSTQFLKNMQKTASECATQTYYFKSENILAKCIEMLCKTSLAQEEKTHAQAAYQIVVQIMVYLQSCYGSSAGAPSNNRFWEVLKAAIPCVWEEGPFLFDATLSLQLWLDGLKILGDEKAPKNLCNEIKTLMASLHGKAHGKAIDDYFSLDKLFPKTYTTKNLNCLQAGKNLGYRPADMLFYILEHRSSGTYLDVVIELFEKCSQHERMCIESILFTQYRSSSKSSIMRNLEFCRDKAAIDYELAKKVNNNLQVTKPAILVTFPDPLVAVKNPHPNEGKLITDFWDHWNALPESTDQYTEDDDWKLSCRII